MRRIMEFSIFNFRLAWRRLLQSQIENRSALLLRDRLGAVHVLVLGLAFCAIELGQELGRWSDIVPAAVLKIDDRFVVPVDRDDASDDPCEALQLGPVR